MVWGYVKMPEKTHRCVQHLREKGYPESSAWPICVSSVKDGGRPSCGDMKNYDKCSVSKSVTDSISVRLTDKAIWDGGKKTAISVRDGVLEYLGVELGIEPVDKTFKVYRSPATIANVAGKMQGIPLTDEHVDLDGPVESPVGSVTGAEMIDFFEDGIDSKLAIKNVVDLSSEILDTLSNGKKELSLGYTANIVPHEKYDFEQRDIEPHHLAVVMAGRCGSECKFIDRKGNADMKKVKAQHAAFADADGTVNLAKVVEYAVAIPEALKLLPLEELIKIAPMLEEVVARAQAGSMPEGQTVPGEEMAGESVESDVVDQEETKEEDESKIMDEEKPEDEKEMEDKESEEDRKKEVKDSAIAFTDAVEKAVSEKLEIIEKAKMFCDSVDVKESSISIMRKAIATEYKDIELKDSEVAVAFKMLKKAPKKYNDFADKAPKGKFDTLYGKEL